MKTIKTEKYNKKTLISEEEKKLNKEEIIPLQGRKELGEWKEWWDKEKLKREVKELDRSSGFDSISRIKDFKILTANPRHGRRFNEPWDGTIKYNQKEYYFRFSHEFDEGNTYIVYENNNPVFYFFLYSDYEGDIGSPMVFEPS